MVYTDLHITSSLRLYPLHLHPHCRWIFKGCLWPLVVSAGGSVSMLYYMNWNLKVRNSVYFPPSLSLSISTNQSWCGFKSQIALFHIRSHAPPLCSIPMLSLFFNLHSIGFSKIWGKHVRLSVLIFFLWLFLRIYLLHASQFLTIFESHHCLLRTFFLQVHLENSSSAGCLEVLEHAKCCVSPPPVKLKWLF